MAGTWRPFIRDGHQFALNNERVVAEVELLSDPPPASPGHDGHATAIRHRIGARADDLQRIM